MARNLWGAIPDRKPHRGNPRPPERQRLGPARAP
jgi:hypothetical protein